MNEKKRIEYLDIAKGICLLLVIYAHARGPFFRFIYQFHMPFFFLVSGYLHNSEKNRKDFILGKLYSLYIPFVFWNLSITILRLLTHPSKTKEYIILLFQILLTIEKDGQYFGATWFPAALFLVSCSYKLIESRIHNLNYVTILFFLIGTIGYFHTFPYMLSRTMILGVFYSIGVFLRMKGFDISKQSNPLTAVLSFIFFLFIAYRSDANMGLNEYSSPIAFLATSLSASYCLFYVSYIMEKHNCTLKNLFLCFNHYALDLILWQFFAFYLVTIIQLLPTGVSVIEILRNYNATTLTSGNWWILYFLFGCLVPIVIGNILRKGFWGKYLEKFHLI